MRQGLILLFILAALVHGRPAGAATIEVTRSDGLAFIHVTGEFKRGDEQAFRRAISNVSDGIVVFHSGGGDLLTGLVIGETIRMRQLATAVPPGAICTSACALAWLAGPQRLKSVMGMVSFHAAWVERDGATAETGAGNAVVGAYLTDLGLPLSAILFATSAGPEDMNWLTEETGREVGIAFVTLEGDGPADGNVAQAPKPREVSPEVLAARFVRRHFEAVSAPNPQYMAHAHAAYASSVDYHGNRLSRPDVIDDIGRFARRWPDRRYAVRGEPSIACDQRRGICRVEGFGVYEAASSARGQISNGIFTFAMEISYRDRLLIVAEESQVIDRLVADMTPGGEDLVRFIQVNLARLGCGPGEIDGRWGSNTAFAIDRFNRATGSGLDPVGPTVDALTALQVRRSGTCGPEVGRGGRTVSRLPGTDLPGGDYRIVKEVPYGTCESSCLADRRCAAFTFNQRHEWCFLKDTVAAPVDFRGAISGIIRQGTIEIEPLSRHRPQ